MNKIAVILFAFTLSLSAQTPKKATKATKATAPKAAAPKANVIPPDAVANADGSYSWTDKQGKKWRFNKTPFGISRMEDMGDSAAAATVSKEQFITFVDSGDSYTFSRKSPFGVATWKRNKSELTPEERRVVDAAAKPAQSNQ